MKNFGPLPTLYFAKFLYGVTIRIFMLASNLKERFFRARNPKIRFVEISLIFFYPPSDEIFHYVYICIYMFGSRGTTWVAVFKKFRARNPELISSKLALFFFLQKIDLRIFENHLGGTPINPTFNKRIEHRKGVLPKEPEFSKSYLLNTPSI